MTNLQKGFYSLVGLVSTISTVSAAGDANTLFGSNLVKTNTGTNGELTSVVQNLITSFLGILGAVAVCFAIYAGFLMTTAGGDEEKVKKGRTIMIQVAIGLVVIFIANSAVRWFIGAITN